MNKATKVAFAILNLNQIAILFANEFTSKSLSGQGEEITFNDGSELILCDSGNYYSIYDRENNIYKVYEVSQNRNNIWEM
jgi:hypothetical protein